MSKVERRAAATHVRAATTGNAVTIAGYALTFDTPYPVAGGPPNGFTEVIHRPAVDRALRDGHDVRLLINHDGLPLARTASGTLRLAADKVGLRVSASLDRDNPAVRQLASAIARGDVDQMSFAFTVPPGGQRWDDIGVRHLDDLNLLDVSVVTYPANPATSVGISRSRIRALAERAQLHTPSRAPRPVAATTSHNAPSPAQRHRANTYGGRR